MKLIYFKDRKCIELAKKHSDAVDFVKTGIETKIPKDLMAKQFPDYMEKKDKQKTYKS